tara:strand:- start:200 stop:898 length:699 start_codon:yes stop_codon:yes gene_type:complete
MHAYKENRKKMPSTVVLERLPLSPRFGQTGFAIDKGRNVDEIPGVERVTQQEHNRLVKESMQRPSEISRLDKGRLVDEIPNFEPVTQKEHDRRVQMSTMQRATEIPRAGREVHTYKTFKLEETEDKNMTVIGIGITKSADPVSDLIRKHSRDDRNSKVYFIKGDANLARFKELVSCKGKGDLLPCTTILKTDFYKLLNDCDAGNECLLSEDPQKDWIALIVLTKKDGGCSIQ